MRVVPLAIVLVLLLAGCAAPTEPVDSDGDGILDEDEQALGTDPTLADSDGDGVPDSVEIDAGTDPLNATSIPIDQLVATIERVVLIAGDRGAGEPSVGVQPDGTIYTNIGSHVYSSDDEGATWQYVGNPNPIINNDPDLAVDKDGTIWESRLYALLCNAVAVSRDDGQTWWNHPAVCAGPVGDRQYVIPTEGGEAYLYWHQVPSFDQTVMKTTDYGVTWTPTNLAENVGTDMIGSGWGGGGFWNEATGSVYLTYTGSANGNFPAYSVTYDGFNWEQRLGPKFDGGRLGLSLVTGAADAAGNVYLTWGENHGGDVAMYVARSTDDGATWEDKIRIDDGRPVSRVFPMIAAGSDGRVAISYYEAESDGHPLDSAGPWNVTLAWTPDFEGANGTWQHVHVAGPVKDTPICPSGTTCNGDREFLDYFAIDVTPEGKVVIVFNSMLEAGHEGARRNVFAITQQAILA